MPNTKRTVMLSGSCRICQNNSTTENRTKTTQWSCWTRFSISI